MSRKVSSAACALDVCIKLAYKHSAFSLSISRLALQKSSGSKRDCVAAFSGTGFGNDTSSLTANVCSDVLVSSCSCDLIPATLYAVQNDISDVLDKKRSGSVAVNVKSGLLLVGRGNGYL